MRLPAHERLALALAEEARLATQDRWVVILVVAATLLLLLVN